jgi:hypothetical protein
MKRRAMGPSSAPARRLRPALGVLLVAAAGLTVVGSAPASAVSAAPEGQQQRTTVALTRSVAAGDAMSRAGALLVPIAGARQRSNADRTTTYTFRPAGPVVPGAGGVSTQPLTGAWVLYGPRTGRFAVITRLEWRGMQSPPAVGLSGEVNGGDRIDLVLSGVGAFGNTLFATNDFQRVLNGIAGTTVLAPLPPTTYAEFGRTGSP